MYRLIFLSLLIQCACYSAEKTDSSSLEMPSRKHSTIEDQLRTQNKKLARLEEVTSQLKAEIRYLKSHCDKKSEKISLLSTREETEARRLSVRSTNAEIAFFAKKTTPLINLGYHQTLVFNEIPVNYGGAYRLATGIFIAPVSGIYVFSWTTSNEPHTHMRTEMQVNGQRYAHTWSDAHDHEDVSVASATCVAQLQQNDKVWIRSGEKTNNGTLTCNGNSMCSFTGFLLYERLHD